MHTGHVVTIKWSSSVGKMYLTPSTHDLLRTTTQDRYEHLNIISYLSNQPDALIIQIYFIIKLYMFRASSLPFVRSSLLYFDIGKFHAGFF